MQTHLRDRSSRKGTPYDSLAANCLDGRLGLAAILDSEVPSEPLLSDPTCSETSAARHWDRSARSPVGLCVWWVTVSAGAEPVPRSARTHAASQRTGNRKSC